MPGQEIVQCHVQIGRQQSLRFLIRHNRRSAWRWWTAFVERWIVMHHLHRTHSHLTELFSHCFGFKKSLLVVCLDWRRVCEETLQTLRFKGLFRSSLSIEMVTFEKKSIFGNKKSFQNQAKREKSGRPIDDGLLCESATCICGWDCKCCGCMVATCGDSELDSSKEKLFILNDIFLRCCGLWGAVRGSGWGRASWWRFLVWIGLAEGLVWWRIVGGVRN